MCIICNTDDGGYNEPAESFLSNFDAARKSMKVACAKMLELSKTAHLAEDRRRYKVIHKRMVKIMKDWNKIEHAREAELPRPLAFTLLNIKD